MTTTAAATTATTTSVAPPNAVLVLSTYKYSNKPLVVSFDGKEPFLLKWIGSHVVDGLKTI